MEASTGQTPDLSHLPAVLAMAADIAAIESRKSLTQKYRSIQSLQLTELQYKLLEGIDAEKIETARLGEIVSAFEALKKVEHMIEGKPTEIKGLVAYLVALEKEDVQMKEADVVEMES